MLMLYIPWCCYISNGDAIYPMGVLCTKWPCESTFTDSLLRIHWTKAEFKPEPCGPITMPPETPSPSPMRSGAIGLNAGERLNNNEISVAIFTHVTCCADHSMQYIIMAKHTPSKYEPMDSGSMACHRQDRGNDQGGLPDPSSGHAALHGARRGLAGARHR